MTDTFLVPNKQTISIIYIHLMRICYSFQCSCTIIRENYASSLTTNYYYYIGLSMGSILQLICQEHKCAVKGTTVCILKIIGNVQWLRTFKSKVVKSETTVPWNIFNHRKLTTTFKIRTIVPFIVYVCMFFAYQLQNWTYRYQCNNSSWFFKELS
jgi:hypothetical protein